MITVIGGAGFIGTRLCKRFHASGVPFSIVDKRISSCFPQHSRVADVRDVERLHEVVDSDNTIINLAAEHRDDVTPKSLYGDVNIGGAENVCEVARRRGVNDIIFTSSVAVYGYAKAGTSETGQIAPYNEYGRTKARAESVYRAWWDERPATRSLTIIRPTVVFGEGNRGNVYELVSSLATHRFLMVGQGRNIKSLAYVENLAAFLEYCVSRPCGLQIFNYADKPDLSVAQLVQTITQHLGRTDLPRVTIPVWLGLLAGTVCDAFSACTGLRFPVSRVRINKFCADTSFTSRVTDAGFAPPIRLEEALRHTIRTEFVDNDSYSLPQPPKSPVSP